MTVQVIIKSFDAQEYDNGSMIKYRVLSIVMEKKHFCDQRIFKLNNIVYKIREEILQSVYYQAFNHLGKHF